MFLSPSTADPSRWGGAVWTMLFALASHFPHARHTDEDVQCSDADVASFRASWRRLVPLVAGMLPCGMCRYHFKAYIAAHPLEQALVSRESLLRWLYDAKADVRRRQRRPVPAFAAVCRRWIPKSAKSSRAG